MTHDEAVGLLPAYALGALDENASTLETHLRDCPRCSALLATYLESTTALGQAVEVVLPPKSLRSSVVGRAQDPAPVPRRREWWRLLGGRASLLAAGVLVVLSVGLGAGNIAQQRQLAQTRSELAVDERGLALLTSTETTVERLAPVAPPTSNEHGHWYHRPGIDTQVVVVEFMPALPEGQAYYGWLHRQDGGWTPVGRFTLDAVGYGRIILAGSDGANVLQVEVTRQAGPSATPAGDVVLRWPNG